MGGSTAFAGYPLWEAHYTTAAAPAHIGGWTTYNLWQFTDAAPVPGITTAVDQSRFNGSAPAALAVRAMPSAVTGPLVLSAGQFLVSPHQQYRLLMQPDGNLVVYGNGAALWSSGTWGHPGSSASLQPDGNLVVYSAAGVALWNSGTWAAGPGVVLAVRDDGDVTLTSPGGSVVWHEGGLGSDRLHPGGSLAADQYIASPDHRYRLVMQSDGNLVDYADGTAVWSTGTFGNPGARVVMRPDGNLVLYAPGNRAVWNSGSWTAGGSSSLVAHDGGDVTVILPDGRVAWHDGAPGDDRLLGPDTLVAGQDLTSPDGQYRLDMQGDGNLVEYGNGRPLWSSGTDGHAGASASLQLDGNLVVHGADGAVLWSSGTYGAGPGAWLSVQDDGDLTLVTPDGKRRWHTGAPGSDLLSAGSQLTGGPVPAHRLREGSGDHAGRRQPGRLHQRGGPLVLGDVGSPGCACGPADRRQPRRVPGGGCGPVELHDLGHRARQPLAMQGDGNVVVYSGTRAVWNAGTFG